MTHHAEIDHPAKDNSPVSVMYLFGYKTGAYSFENTEYIAIKCFFRFQNNPKDLVPSYKTDLDLWN